MRDKRTALLLADEDRDRWSWELRSEPLIKRAHRILEGFFDEILVVAREPEKLGGLDMKVVGDEYGDAGLLGALTTGLKRITSHYAFAVGADMPFLHPLVIRHLYAMRKGWDVVVPQSPEGFEPMCAVYSKTCVAPMEERVARGNLKVLDFISEVRTRIVNREDLEVLDPSGLTFKNVHTQADLDQCRLHLARLRSYGPPGVAVVAPEGGGKTALIAELTAELNRRGYRVGAVRQGSKGFEIKSEGDEVKRLRTAGAAPVVVSTGQRMVMACPGARAILTLDEIIHRYMTEVDIVLMEGGEGTQTPRIELLQPNSPPSSIDKEGRVTDHRLIALVGDGANASPVPLFSPANCGPLCDFLEEQYLAGA